VGYAAPAPPPQLLGMGVVTAEVFGCRRREAERKGFVTLGISKKGRSRREECRRRWATRLDRDEVHTEYGGQRLVQDKNRMDSHTT
jgi:hypothetical protein